MGVTKREIERLEGLRVHTLHVLRETKAIMLCSECGEYELHNMDDDAEKQAYAAVTAQHKAGEIDGSLREIRDAVKSALEDVHFNCPNCEHDDAD